MDLGSILIILALVLLTATFIAQPLIEQQSICGPEEDHRLSTLQTNLVKFNILD